jgi:hypothetical protein
MLQHDNRTILGGHTAKVLDYIQMLTIRSSSARHSSHYLAAKPTSLRLGSTVAPQLYKTNSNHINKSR